MKSTSSDSLVEAWASLSHFAGRAAIVDTRRRVLRTFAQIEEEARDFERTLLHEFRRGEVIVIQVGNHAAWPALLLAGLRRQLVVVPLERTMARRERDSVLRICCAAAILETAGNANTISGRIALRSLPHESIDWGSNCPSLLKLTSGTTAAPRAIRFRSEQLLADCTQICETMCITEHDLNFGVIPFSHSYGFSNLIMPLLCRGVRLVASEDRMPRAILDGLDRSGATVFPGMPVFFEKLAELENPPRPNRLRLCISAGAPLPGRVAEKFALQFGAKIHTFYGASECGGICYDREGDVESAEGFVGSAMEGVSISLLQSETPTRIEVRSRAVGDGYFPQSDPASLGDGRFVPGDLIEKSGAGYRIAGRVSDVINVAGRKLNPHEVEAQLMRFPHVRQAVVFGVGSSLRNEEAVACVVSDGADSEDLIRFCRASLSAWQVPKAIWFVAEIPTSERGKISRRELAEKYRLSQQTEISRR
ncbi:MAG: acyl--CoA ligase [Verrucomicrobiota bacterium]|nr:acyl--CoA ligase [Verrucomicrobiota bacterium]